MRLATVDGSPVRVLSQPIEIAGVPYVIQVVGDRAAEQRTLTTLLIVLLVGGVAALGLAAGAGFLYAGNALVPIRDSLRRQREFAADASHELRTPLTIVRGNVERLRRDPEPSAEERTEALDDIEVEVDHLAGLVDDLLLFARSDSGMVRACGGSGRSGRGGGRGAAAAPPAGRSRGVTLSLDAAPAAVTGDADRLRQLVAILVDNAIRHSSVGGTVHVLISPAGRPSLRVDDEGQGIRPEDLPNVFERFYRAPDAPSGGTGLGLAIAAWIADHHGGVIRAFNRREGGARFEVQLPPA